MAQTLLSEALCTLVDIKDYLGLTGSSYDTRLTLAVNQATRLILEDIQIDVASTARTDLLDGTGVSYLQLRHYPVIGSIVVYEDGERDFPSSSVVSSDDYEVDTDAGLVFRVGAAWPEGRRNVKVTYTSGYAAIPDTLKHAAIEFAAFLYRNQGARGLSSQKLGSVSQTQEAAAVPTAIRQQLDPFRRQHEVFDFLDAREP